MLRSARASWATPVVIVTALTAICTYGSITVRTGDSIENFVHLAGGILGTIGDFGFNGVDAE